MKTNTIFLMCIIVVIVFIGVPQSIANPPDSVETITSKQNDKNSLLYLPFIYYSPETKIAFGVMVNYINNTRFPESKPSGITSTLMYTQKNQLIASIDSEVYLDNSNYHFKGMLEYLKFPSYFYGIGTNAAEDNEEEFTPEQYILETSLKYQFFPQFYFGLGYDFDKFSLIKKDSGGVLKDGTIVGSEGGINSVIKVITTYDSRDSRFWPVSGYFGEIIYGVSNSYTGSDFDYTSVMVDLRKYFFLINRFALANQVYFESVNGDAPFNHLPQVGGDFLMRGYYTGRYTDKNMYILQTELRFPVWRKFGITVFGDIGDVAPEVTGFRSENIKSTYGFGLRYRINDEKTNVRVDFGFGDNTFGFYISFAEAF